MFEILKPLLAVAILATITACTNHKNDEEEVDKSPANLSKAATFNMQLGLGYLNQGDRPRAKTKLLTALKQEPNSADINAAMAYYLEKTSELDQAKKYYLKAISLSDNGGAQLNNYGTFLCRQAQYKSAESYFLKAVEDQHYINSAGAYENAGLCSLAVPDTEKASMYFKKALNQDPTRRESLYELVKIENKAGNDAQVLKLLEEYPELVLKDKELLELAKNSANKLAKFDLASEYDVFARKLTATDDNSSSGG